MLAQFDLSLFVNLFAFFGLTVATYTIFYFGRSNQAKGVSINLFVLALGINLIGVSHLFRIWFESSTSPLINLIVAAGSVSIMVGILWVAKQRSIEMLNLKARGAEINAVIKKLKDKYYQQELSEEELKAAYSGLLRELAEIEVKLESKKRKKR